MAHSTQKRELIVFFSNQKRFPLTPSNRKLLIKKFRTNKEQLEQIIKILITFNCISYKKEQTNFGRIGVIYGHDDHFTKRIKMINEMNEFNKKKQMKMEENLKIAVQKLNEAMQIAKDGCDRWTDNINRIVEWFVTQKRGCFGFSRKDILAKWGLPDDFDYVQ
eukprot:305601_1